MTSQKGFTIIELLVVIAIIAVLAGIVLVNVTSYINKGKDAAIKGNLATLMTNAAVFFDTNSTYVAFDTNTSTGCGTGSPVRTAITGAGSTLFCGTCTSAACAACAQLKTTAADYYCVDSTGAKKQITGTCAALTVCP